MRRARWAGVRVMAMEGGVYKDGGRGGEEGESEGMMRFIKQVATRLLLSPTLPVVERRRQTRRVGGRGCWAFAVSVCCRLLVGCSGPCAERRHVMMTGAGMMARIRDARDRVF